MNDSSSTNPSDGNRLKISRSVNIPLDEIRFTYSRSSGPGGQNVNKVNTKVQLRWNVAESDGLTEAQKEVISRKCSRRISADGDLMVTSQRYRDQSRNVSDSLDKLRELLIEALRKPKPRKKTKPSRASKERRLKEKKQRAEKKRRRQSPPMG